MGEKTCDSNWFSALHMASYTAEGNRDVGEGRDIEKEPRKEWVNGKNKRHIKAEHNNSMQGKTAVHKNKRARLKQKHKKFRPNLNQLLK